MIGSWSNRIIEESRCHVRERHALDMTNLDVNYVALRLGEVGDGPIQQHGDCHLRAGPVAEADPAQAPQWASLTAGP